MRIQALTLVLLVLPLVASAQVYTCTDSKGRFISSDRLGAECENREVRILDKQGAVIQVIPAPVSPAKRQAAAQKKQDRQAELEHQREDQAMLMRFRSEDDIEAARKQELGRVAGQLKNAQAALNQSRQQLKNAQESAKSGKDNAAVAKKRIRDAQFGLNQQQQLVDRASAEQDAINTRYDDMLKRYRDLKANPEKMVPMTENDEDDD